VRNVLSASLVVLILGFAGCAQGPNGELRPSAGVAEAIGSIGQAGGQVGCQLLGLTGMPGATIGCTLAMRQLTNTGLVSQVRGSQLVQLTPEAKYTLRRALDRYPGQNPFGCYRPLLNGSFPPEDPRVQKFVSGWNDQGLIFTRQQVTRETGSEGAGMDAAIDRAASQEYRKLHCSS
jgi:hypothetical protein